MHARINYVDIKPDNFAEVDEFWRTVVRGYEGLVRGYFLRDGDTAHTLSVVVFETEQHMLTNTEQQLGDVVKRAASHRLSEPVLHHMEICADVPFTGGPGRFARVIDVTLKPDRMNEVIADWAEHVSKYAGLRGALMCADRSTGATKSISLWGSKDDALANEQSGALASAVEPYKEMIAVEPVRSYWDVRVEV